VIDPVGVGVLVGKLKLAVLDDCMAHQGDVIGVTAHIVKLVKRQLENTGTIGERLEIKMMPRCDAQ
jgi:hypothetical protein